MKFYQRILFLSIILILLFNFGLARSYYIEKAELEYYIKENGTVDVIEYLTFNFDGEYNYISRELPTNNSNYWNYSNFKVFVDGQETFYTTEYRNENTIYEWNYKVINEKKTFEIKYTINNAIFAYNDISEFYWTIWDESWPIRVNEITGFIILPKKLNDAKEIYTWGHPEVNGKIGVIDEQKIIFQIFNVPSYYWVEIRTLFPSHILTIEKSSENALQRIIDEENQYKSGPDGFNSGGNKNQGYTIEPGIFGLLFISPIIIFLIFIIFFKIFFIKAGSKLSNLIPQSKINKLIGTALLLVAIYLTITSNLFQINFNNIILIIIITILLSIYLFCRYFISKAPKINYLAEYEREIPYDYSPGIVKLLLTTIIKTPTPSEISSEILYLCLKGYLKIEKALIEGKEEFLIHIIKTDYSNLSPSQIKLMELLQRIAFADPQTLWEKYIIKKKKEVTPNILSIRDITVYLSLNKEYSSKWLKSWQKKLSNEYKLEKFDENYNGLIIYIISSFVIIYLTGIILFQNIFLIIIFIIALPLVFNDFLIKRTEKGELHYQKWNNLKKFLRDFSQMKNMPPHAITLWEGYLVYATVLGEGKTVEKAMKFVFKDTEFKSNIFIARTGSFNSANFASIGNNFSSAFNNATKSSGSSGFSGGGGVGGGRGGGGGAR